ncbi:MAG TPA: hypothetical protein VNE39_10860 [Planctomycetota bacterium]|nr:hypothetical protein [Planctomycetota bacterium]
MDDDGFCMDAGDWGAIVRELDEKLEWLDIPACAGEDESFAASWLAFTYQLANVFTQAEVIQAAARRAGSMPDDRDLWCLAEALREFLIHAGDIVQLTPRLLTIVASHTEGRALLRKAPDGKTGQADRTEALAAYLKNMKRRPPNEGGASRVRAAPEGSVPACERAASTVVARMHELLAKPTPQALACVVTAVAALVSSATSLLWELRDWDFKLGGAVSPPTHAC